MWWLVGQTVFVFVCLFFFFNDTATTEIYTLSLHDALPILVNGMLNYGLLIRMAIPNGMMVSRLKIKTMMPEKIMVSLILIKIIINYMILLNKLIILNLIIVP